VVKPTRLRAADPQTASPAVQTQLLDNPVVVLVLLVAVIAAGIAGGAGFGGNR
jgi:hypothetical protein